MTPIQIVAVCLRFLAIAWLLYALGHFYGVWTYFGGDDQPLSKWAVAIQVLLQLAICAALWFFPVTIAGKLLPPYSKPPDPQSPPRLHDWQTVGAICVGLWVLSRGVPDFIYWLTFMNMTFSGGSSFSEMGADQKASLFATLAELAIGIWLVFGAKGIAGFFLKIRTAGVAK